MGFAYFLSSVRASFANFTGVSDQAEKNPTNYYLSLFLFFHLLLLLFAFYVLLLNKVYRFVRLFFLFELKCWKYFLVLGGMIWYFVPFFFRGP